MPQRVANAKMPTDSNGNIIQIFLGNGSRVNLTAGATSTRAALPSGVAARLAIIRATDYVWVAFGSDSVDAAATAASILVPPGEGLINPPAAATHIAVLRAGSADSVVQLEAPASQ